MNYYIDFDNTLYNSTQLTKRMLNTISNCAALQKNLEQKEVLKVCKQIFNRDHIYNIYELITYISDKYGLNSSLIHDSVDRIIANSEDLVYSDVIPFLINLKKQNHSIYMLSCAENRLKYQTAKIAGSGILNYFDAVFVVSSRKHTLDINYSNGIFIDDNPKDLLELYSKNPKEVIRLRRKDNRYSLKDLNEVNIKEYEDFSQIPIN